MLMVFDPTERKGVRDIPRFFLPYGCEGLIDKLPPMTIALGQKLRLRVFVDGDMQVIR